MSKFDRESFLRGLRRWNEERIEHFRAIDAWKAAGSVGPLPKTGNVIDDDYRMMKGWDCYWDKETSSIKFDPVNGLMPDPEDGSEIVDVIAGVIFDHWMATRSTRFDLNEEEERELF